MENGKNFQNSQIIILGVCIALATIAASFILSQGALKVMKFSQQVISVTGSAQKSIRSDYIVWKASITRREIDLPTACKRLLEDLEKVKSYLASQKVNPSEIIVSQIATSTMV